MSAEQRDDYIRNAHELTEAEIKSVFESLEEAREIFERGAKSARHELFAHSNIERGESDSKAIAGVVVGDFERMIDILYTAYASLNGAFSNGHEPLKKSLSL